MLMIISSGKKHKNKTVYTVGLQKYLHGGKEQLSKKKKKN